MSFRNFVILRTTLCATLLVFFLGLLSSLQMTAFAQQADDQDDGGKKPIYLTVRVFQAKTSRAAKYDMTDQMFRLRTPGLTDYDKWVSSIGKAYPGLELSLIRTEELRVFMSPMAGKVILGPKKDRNLQFLVNVAQSPGDGETPGLSIIPFVEYHFGDETTDRKYPPVPQFMPPPIEYEAGMTYFFSHKSLSYKPESYVSFVRPGAPVSDFVNDEVFFVFVVTREPGNPLKPGGDKPTARVFKNEQSDELQANATKKADPEWPVEIQKPGYDGRIQVRVEITPDGHVAHTNIWNSTLPEANRQAIAAALKWEFPATVFAETQLPVYTLLTFNYKAPAPKPAKPEPAKKNPTPARKTPAKTIPKRPVK